MRKNRVQLYQNLVLLLITICAGPGTVVQKMYDKIEPGRNITGELVAVPGVRSYPECVLM